MGLDSPGLARRPIRDAIVIHIVILTAMLSLQIADGK